MQALRGKIVQTSSGWLLTDDDSGEWCMESEHGTDQNHLNRLVSESRLAHGLHQLFSISMQSLFIVCIYA
jgi:hypothetical protein